MDHGQGKADPGATLSQFNPGNYVYGDSFKANKYVGEYVLVVLGGS